MILGIDTSNYTTSVCMIDKSGNIVYENRKILPVKEGQRGLRQSDAVYEHVRNLPELTDGIDKFDISCIAASVTPRRVEGSFMPCFLVGKNFAKTMANLLHVPFHETTHQEGHIASALMGNADIDASRPFIFVHLSGGTTEILLCREDEYGYDCKIIGNTSDISAGQFIDRVGVNLGMQFPCGAEMDSIFDSENKELTLPTSVKGSVISFAGVETMVAGLIEEESITRASAVSAVFRCVGRSIGRAVEYAAKEHGIKDIILGGGVSSSMNVKNIILKELHPSRSVHSSPKGLSADNSVGVALLGLKHGGRND